MAKTLARPTKRMKSSAWRTLHAVATDPEAAEYARVYAARTIVGDEPERSGDDGGKTLSEPRPTVLMPHNGRDDVALGISGEPGAWTVTYDASTEQGREDLDRWISQIDGGQPKLALPAPARKAPMTNAERSARYRQRKAARLAAPA